MKRINLLIGGPALSLTFLVVSACSTVNHTASSSPAVAANGGLSASASPTASAGGTAAPNHQEPPKSPEDEVPRVSATEAKRLVEEKQAVLVDVRSEDAYRSGHAQGALHVALDQIEKGEYKALPRNKQIITYCT
jgi:3-mercaptopyruvate sulfurtransferase SseA